MSGTNLPKNREGREFLTHLAAEGRRQRALRRPLLALLGLYLLLLILPSPALFALFASVIFSVTFSVALSLRLSASRFRRAALEHLPQIEDIHLVGLLLEALDIPDKKARQTVASALIHLLPRLRREDGKLLTDYQR